MWRARKHRGLAEPEELVLECEAFLSGQYAQCLRDSDRGVPAWAWLNVLAHGSDGQLGGLASANPGHEPAPTPATAWPSAMALLAREILNRVAQGGETLAELQRLALVPLELDFASRRSWTPTPAMFVGAVRSALHQHRSSPRT